MIAQIISEGIVGSYLIPLFGSVITILMVILGFMLKRNLERIEDIIKAHDSAINEQRTDIEILKYSHRDTTNLSQQILDKLRAITPE